MMDPVTLEICWSRLIGVVNEQALALQRTSFTSIVREAGDLSAGVFDRRGLMVAQAVTGTPGHINSMALAMKHFLAAYPLETLAPGDVLITNDPWKMYEHSIGHFLPHVLAGALGQAVPDRVMAEGSANIWGINVSGRHESGDPFVYFWVCSGGTGARATKDGLSATAFPSGVLGTPVEVIENLAPLVVERKCLRPDSGGTGRYRGGLGQTIAFRARTREPYTCSILCDRTAHAAAGFLGGGPGARGVVLIDGVAPANPKAEQLVPPGALVEVRLPGGGGYGPPAERDPDLVARDLLEGYVTRP